MRVRILSVAEEDLEEGFRFYESQLCHAGRKNIGKGS